MKVAMRLMGHQFLQKIGDSSSRVLPIEQYKGAYKIGFEKPLVLQPDSLIAAVHHVVKEKEIGRAYILEVKLCGEEDVIYSFEVDSVQQMDMMPCGGREYPKACYEVYFSLKEPFLTYPIHEGGGIQVKDESGNVIYWVCLSSLLLISVFLWLQKKNKPVADDSHLIRIGLFCLDKRNATLSINDEQTELSGKEIDLLLMLHQHVNQTVERDEILNKVWGDEGDYIGRTLDVFISKLRKKLDADPDVKIVNIRGVGYKLVVDAD